MDRHPFGLVGRERPGQCVGEDVREEDRDLPLSCYPDPSTGLIHFPGELRRGGEYWLTIRDVASRVVDQVRLNGGAVMVHRTNGQCGSYLHTLEREGELAQQGKLIVL